MDDRQRKLVKHLSLTLMAIAVVFAITSTYLSINYHIDLSIFVTPFIITFVVVVLGFGVIKRLVADIATPKSKKAIPVQEEPTALYTHDVKIPSGIKPLSIEASPPSCLDRYEALQEESLRREAARRKDILNCVNEYVTDITAEYLSKKNLALLIENIEHLACGRVNEYKPVRSDMEKKLKSPDLRHLAWNIGERLGVSRHDRAGFIRGSFPKELESATIPYLEANLRDSIPCHIKIDVPDKGDYRFHYTPQAAA